MILHTVLSMEEVLAGRENIKAPQMAFQNGHMVEMDEGGNLVRLISTDPSDYLDQKFFPGTPLKGKKE
ncbi:hypothetical protein SDC9_131123 [bioreactor metagenome]|uniref:YlzJ-like protein n=1 Tax=bioreactor metagenome TaxID=1076179 RepID=A0A645D5Y5_9ZZZZ